MKLPNPIAWLCTDFDGHYGIGVTKELAKVKAGEHCNDFLPLHPESDFTAFQQRIEALEAALAEAGKLPARVLAMCHARGWSMHWTHRGAYLHLESSELIEALRGKRGDPVGEAADVLLVLMSITESNGIAWNDVLAQCVRTVEKLETKPRYPGEEFDDAIAAKEQA